MDSTITKQGNLLIAAKDNNFEILDTNTGIITNSWGLPVLCGDTQLWADASSVGDYYYWLSFVEKGMSSLYGLWEDWHKAGVVLHLSSNMNYNPDYLRALLSFFPPQKFKFDPALKSVSILAFSIILREAFFGTEEQNLDGYQRGLFAHALIYASHRDATALYALMEREKTTQFWAENLTNLRNYIIHKRQHNGSLECVRDTWRDYTTTLQKAISAQTHVRGLLEDM